MPQFGPIFSPPKVSLEVLFLPAFREQAEGSKVSECVACSSEVDASLGLGLKRLTHRTPHLCCTMEGCCFPGLFSFVYPPSNPVIMGIDLFDLEQWDLSHSKRERSIWSLHLKNDLFSFYFPLINQPWPRLQEDRLWKE